MNALPYVVGLAFLGIQVSVALIFLGAYLVQRNRLKKLRSGDLSRADAAASTSWLAFVNTAFPEGTTMPGAWKREDVHQELENWLFSWPSYLFLQRTAIAAPLIGVVITVLAFWTVELDSSADSTISEIMLHVRPLFVGVFCGAGLALANQLLLYLASIGLNRLRSQWSSWFDDVVWNTLTSRPDTAMADTVDALRTVTETVLGCGEALTSGVQQVQTNVQTISVAAQDILQASASVSASLGEMPQQFTSITELTTSVGQEITGLVSSVKATNETMESSATQFQEVVQDRFAPAVETHERAVADLISVFENAGALSSRLDSVQASVERIVQAAGRVVDSTADLSNAAQKLPAEAERIGDLTEAAVANLGQLAAASETTNERMQTTLAAFQEVVDERFAPAAETHHRAATDLATWVAGEEGIVPRLTELNDVLTELRQAVSGIQSAVDVERDVIPYVRTLKAAAEAVDDMSHVPDSVRECFAAVQAGVNGTASQLNEQLHEFTRQAMQARAQELVGLLTGVLDQLEQRMDSLASRLESLTTRSRPLPPATGRVGSNRRADGQRRRSPPANRDATG